MSVKSNILKSIEKMQDGVFSPAICGTVYGFSFDPNSGETVIFDTVEDDDARVERFKSIADALNGFKIGDTMIGDVRGLSVEANVNI